MLIGVVANATDLERKGGCGRTSGLLATSITHIAPTARALAPVQCEKFASQSWPTFGQACSLRPPLFGNAMTLIENPQSPGAVLYELLREARDSFDIETRCEMRYSFCRLVSISAGNARYPGMSREISASGIGLLHPEQLPLGEAEICIRLHDNDVVVRARIQWCRPLGEGWFISGALFTDVVDE